MKLSDRIQSIEESKTVQFSSLIHNLRKQGKAVIDFAVGEPGFDPPQEVIDSTKEALDAKKTRYGPVTGLPELKAKLAGAFEGYGEENIILQWRSQLQRRRDIAYEYASKLFDCIRPQGAFYVFPDISKHLKSGKTSEDFAAKILTHAGVAVVPGEAFDMPNHIRISYAVPENLLIKGFRKIAEVL
jgi:aspartate/methionine/tyrosine aminotransferase